MNDNLENYIKYCLDYVKLARQRNFASQRKNFVSISEEQVSLIGLLNGDTDGHLEELLKLDIFYSLDPKQVTEKDSEQYEKEKSIASKVEDIYSKYRNNEYIKQIVLNFGFFEIELPVLENDDTNDTDDDLPEDFSKRVDRFPLFSMPIHIEKKSRGKYHIYTSNTEVQVNTSLLEDVLGENLFYQLIEEIKILEDKGDLNIPITDDKVFIDIWHKTKALLKTTEAIYDEKSFSLEEMQIALSSKSNYFLAEDLQNMINVDEKDLNETSLSSWTEDWDDEFDGFGDSVTDKEVYFPFPYDESQYRSLGLSKNKASIIQGPPGTGKSQTIANLICHYSATGKRVLFVSQKSQAVKVVKDKLKELNVAYLFGYIPNLSSAQVNEIDEKDGVANMLTSLAAHMENIGINTDIRKKLIEYNKNDLHDDSKKLINKESTELNKLKKLFNSVVEVQREIFSKSQKISDLESFIVPIRNVSKLTDTFDEKMWKEINNNRTLVNRIQEEREEYHTSSHKNKFDELFHNYDLTVKGFSVAIKSILSDVHKTGYDRNSNIIRAFNNLKRKVRLKRTREKLPKEIIDYIDEALNKESSRKSQEIELMELENYLVFCENKNKIKELKTVVKKSLETCGLSENSFKLFNSLVIEKSKRNFDSAKDNVIKVYKLEKQRRELEKSTRFNINDISKKIKNARKGKNDHIANYLQNIINNKLFEKWKIQKNRAIISKLAKAFRKSKRAFKTFDDLRKNPENFRTIVDLIPTWVMELDDASRLIPLDPNIFDIVILDEASECNIAYTLPSMFRGKKVIFVGDSEQMKDGTTRFKSNKFFDELAKKYNIPDELKIKATGDAVQSVLDISELRGTQMISLRYHYRSPRELIGFSNKYFYKPKNKGLVVVNDNYITYKNTNRIMTINQVEVDLSEEISDKINVSEAKAILKYFGEIRKEKRCSEMSVGILTFFNAQASYIREVFEEAGYKEEEDNYKISIIEGIQGDEKDIVLYSFVIKNKEDKRKYVPLTGEGGDIQGAINTGRVNVAFSRAKKQVHCFISMPISEIPGGIWIKRYLEYVNKNGEIGDLTNEKIKCTNKFEENVYDYLRSELGKDYSIRSQVNSCGYIIDFVIHNKSNGQKIAFECDGPTHFKDELDDELSIYVQNDLDRQERLEVAGWDFYRIKYSDWTNQRNDKGIIIKDIVSLLNT
ncbi:MAG: AAA domain-containing protein [bacterium]